MLLPSAISCDAPLPPPVFHHRSGLEPSIFASPPASPPRSFLDAGPARFHNIMDACRSLQSLLTSPQPPPLCPAPSRPPLPSSTALVNALGITLPQSEQQLRPSANNSLPSPPPTNVPLPSKIQLRTRSRTINVTISENVDTTAKTPSRVVKRVTRHSAAKRRRLHDNEFVVFPSNRIESDIDGTSEGNRTQCLQSPAHIAPKQAAFLATTCAQDDAENRGQVHTPKRSRIAPEITPLGLTRADFHNLDATDMIRNEWLYHKNMSHPVSQLKTQDGETWSTEDDRVLVELVLEKLKLSKQEWEDCARSLGKDRGSVGRRWKSLVMNREIGLQRSRAESRSRARIHNTWR